MADGNITVEVRTQAAQAELDRLRADNAALRREAHTWWTAARDAMKLREPLAPEVIEAAAAEAFGYEGGLQEVNLGDLLHFARTLEQRHGIGPNARLTGPQRPQMKIAQQSAVSTIALTIASPG